MRAFTLSALTLTPVLALLLTSCGKEDTPEIIEPEPEPEVTITYGKPEFTLVSTTATDYGNGHVKVSNLGEDFQMIFIAKKAVYKDGILTDQEKYSKVNDMQIGVSAVAGWLNYERAAINDSTLLIKISIPENRVGEGQSGDLSVSIDDQKFKLSLEQEKALIEFSDPIFQNDYKNPYLLFSRSGDTERKLRFRAIIQKTINGKATGETSLLNGIDWSCEIDKTDIFMIQSQGEESGIQYLKLKAVPNNTGVQIPGSLKINYEYKAIKGTMTIPMLSSEGYIIDIDDGKEPVFHE